MSLVVTESFSAVGRFQNPNADGPVRVYFLPSRPAAQIQIQPHALHTHVALSHVGSPSLSPRVQALEIDSTDYTHLATHEPRAHLQYG